MGKGDTRTNNQTKIKIKVYSSNNKTCCASNVSTRWCNSYTWTHTRNNPSNDIYNNASSRWDGIANHVHPITSFNELITNNYSYPLPTNFTNNPTNYTIHIWYKGMHSLHLKMYVRSTKFKLPQESLGDSTEHQYHIPSSLCFSFFLSSKNWLSEDIFHHR